MYALHLSLAQHAAAQASAFGVAIGGMIGGAVVSRPFPAVDALHALGGGGGAGGGGGGGGGGNVGAAATIGDTTKSFPKLCCKNASLSHPFTQ